MVRESIKLPCHVAESTSRTCVLKKKLACRCQPYVLPFCMLTMLYACQQWIITSSKWARTSRTQMYERIHHLFCYIIIFPLPLLTRVTHQYWLQVMFFMGHHSCYKVNIKMFSLIHVFRTLSQHVDLFGQPRSNSHHFEHVCYVDSWLCGAPIFWIVSCLR